MQVSQAVVDDGTGLSPEGQAYPRPPRVLDSPRARAARFSLTGSMAAREVSRLVGRRSNAGKKDSDHHHG